MNPPGHNLIHDKQLLPSQKLNVSEEKMDSFKQTLDLLQKEFIPYLELFSKNDKVQIIIPNINIHCDFSFPEPVKVIEKDHTISLYFNPQNISDKQMLKEIYWDTVSSIYYKVIQLVNEILYKDFSDGYTDSYFDTYRKRFISLCNIKKTHRVLDLGTAKGAMALLAAEKAKEAVGIDIAPNVIAQAKKLAVSLNIKNVSFKVDNAINTSFNDGSMDVIISAHTIYVLPDYLKRKIFAEIYRILKPGGLLRMWDHHPQYMPIAWTEDQWAEELKKSGFEIESIEKQERDEPALFFVYGDFLFEAIFIKAQKPKTQHIISASSPNNLSNKFLNIFKNLLGSL